MTEDNRSILESAVKTGQEVSWSYNADRARKYGVAGENTITVRVMDRQARLVPDVSVTVHVE